MSLFLECQVRLELKGRNSQTIYTNFSERELTFMNRVGPMWRNRESIFTVAVGCARKMGPLVKSAIAEDIANIFEKGEPHVDFIISIHIGTPAVRG